MNAERQAAWRERKKAQGGQESQDYWMKERKRDVDRRKAWSNTKRAKEAKASTQRKQASRQRIAAAGKHPDVVKSAVESQAFQHRLAVAKLKQRLPRSPRKQVTVIRHLAVSIEAFYSRHDISREAPGMKDTVIVRTAGIKEIQQLRHLMYKLREV